MAEERSAWITSLYRRLERAQSGIPSHTLTVRREELEALFARVAELEDGYRLAEKHVQDAWKAAGEQHREMIEAQSAQAELREQVEMLQSTLAASAQENERWRNQHRSPVGPGLIGDPAEPGDMP